MSAQGVTTDPEKTLAVSDWPVPTTVRQVRSFWGFVGYYRRFIPGFARVAAPLTNLLQGTAGRPSAPVTWSQPCQDAFNQLKQKLLEAPILAFADFTQPFRLYTDASLEGLGAVLSQVQEGQERVTAYASRSLSRTERNDQNYSSFKLELLALKWAVTEKFKDYLWGAQFTVYTDNNPLVHLDTAKLGALEQRWVAQLANFSYVLKYRPGAVNQNADLLSRLPEGNTTVQMAEGLGGPEGNTLAVQAEPEVAAWVQSQREDLELGQVHRWLNDGGLPTLGERRQLPPGLRGLLAEWEQLSIQGGLLVRTVMALDTQTLARQLVVPLSRAQGTWQEYHRAAGYANPERVLFILRHRFFWVGMGKADD